MAAPIMAHATTTAAILDRTFMRLLLKLYSRSCQAATLQSRLRAVPAGVNPRSHDGTQVPRDELALAVPVQLALAARARRGAQHQREQPLPDLLHAGRAVDDLAAVEVDVLFLAVPQRGIGGQLERRRR